MQTGDDFQVVWFIVRRDDAMADQEVHHDHSAAWPELPRRQCLFHLIDREQFEVLDLVIARYEHNIRWQFEVKHVWNYGMQESGWLGRRGT